MTAVRSKGRSAAPGIWFARMRAFSKGMTTSSVPWSTSVAQAVTPADSAVRRSRRVATSQGELRRRRHAGAPGCAGGTFADLLLDEIGGMGALKLRRVEHRARDAIRLLRSSGSLAHQRRLWFSGSTRRRRDRHRGPSPPARIRCVTRSRVVDHQVLSDESTSSRPRTRRLPVRRQASSTATASRAMFVSVISPAVAGLRRCHAGS